MKIFLTNVIAVLFLLLLQTALLPPFFNSWPVPQLVLIFLLLMTVQAGTDFSDLVGLTLLAGLFTDFLSSLTFGVFTVTFLFLVLITGIASRQWIEAGLNVKNIVMIIVFSSVVIPLVIGMFSSHFPSLGYIVTLTLLSLPCLFALNKFVHVRA